MEWCKLLFTDRTDLNTSLKGSHSTCISGRYLAVGIFVKHRGKIVLWLFPGFNFSQFAKENEILKRIRKNEYWWLDSADCEWDTPEEEEAYDKRGEFWESAFERFKSYVPSRMGLIYEFFTDEDVFRLGDFLHMEYEKYLKRGGK